jgi:hypothetical protein
METEGSSKRRGYLPITHCVSTPRTRDYRVNFVSLVCFRNIFLICLYALYFIVIYNMLLTFLVFTVSLIAYAEPYVSAWNLSSYISSSAFDRFYSFRFRV